MDKRIQTVPHIAFEVEGFDFELDNRNLKILTALNVPVDGTRAAMIEHNGAPIELIEFETNKTKKNEE